MAPLHQTACLDPARTILLSRPELRQVACFDTAFHRDLASVYRRFALPLEFETKGIRRYGFHGLSFEYIVRRINRPDLRMVVAHLGGGCSLCAIHGGKSVNTTMSFTPLDGLMMATRSGAIDPGLILYLQQSEGMSVAEVENSALSLAPACSAYQVFPPICVCCSRAPGSERIGDAVDQFCARVAEQVAVMATAMNGMDLLVFTGGIGGSSVEIPGRIFVLD